MKCQFCGKGTLHKGKVSVTIEKNDRVFIFRNVPAQVCNYCGEDFTDTEVTEKLRKKLNQALKNKKGLQVLELT